MGTVNILECLRRNPGAISFLNVTTDKVYENNDLENHGFKEDEKLDGYDPYSNSKSCSELVTHSYKKSFFSEAGSPANWKNMSEANAPHEASFLKLDCSKARETFGWEPVWNVDRAIRETVEWYKAWNAGENMRKLTEGQIEAFFKE